MTVKSAILAALGSLLGIDATGQFPTTPTPLATDNSTKVINSAWAVGGFAVLAAANGYIKLPTWLGGIIFNWGTYTTSGTVGTAVTFGAPYTTACYTVTATATATSSVPGAVDSVNALTTTGFNVDGWQTGGSARSAHGGNYFSVGK